MIDKEKEAALIAYMQKHRGRANAVSNGMLAAELKTDNRTAQKIYAELSKDSNGPILGSHPDYGFFLIEDKEDMDLTIRQYDSRIAHMSESRKAILKKWEDKNTVPIPSVKSYIEQCRMNLAGSHE